MIDIGTTTLSSRASCTAASSPWSRATSRCIEELLPDEAIELVVLGGVVRRNYRSLVGVLAEDSLRQLTADVAFLGASGIGDDLSVMGHDHGRGADQARDDRGARSASCCSRTRRSSRCSGIGARVRARTSSTSSSPTRRRRAGVPRSTGRRRGGARVKIAILGGGGFRVPMVYGALLARAGAARARGGGALRRRASGGSRRSRRCSKGLERGARRAARRSAPTTALDDALDGADFVFCAIRVGRLEGRVVDEQVPLDEGVVGQETTGPGGICFALRTVPVMVDAGRGGRRARAAARGSSTSRTRRGSSPRRSRACSATARSAICDSPAGLCRRVAARARPRPRASSGSTTSGSTTSAGCAACTTASATCCPGCSPTTTLLAVVRGGPAVRRRVAALARDDPERVPLLLLLRVATRSARSARALESRGEFLLRPAGRVLRRRTAARPERRSRRGGRRAASASETYFAEAHAAAGHPGEDDDWEDVGGYEGEAIAVVEAIALNERARADPQHGQPEQPAVPRRSGRSSRCRASSAAPGPSPLAVGEVPGHARALVETIKEVERTTIARR